ncbi:MAG TPA: PQQ-binding-like beta-propeller repeat protein [Ktedonobacteraceae bacterium]
MVFIFHIVSPANTAIVQPTPVSTASASGIYISSEAAGQPDNYLISRLDLTSHRIIWSKPIGTLTSSIVVQENTVYVSAIAGPYGKHDYNDVYAFDATNGTLRWQSTVSQALDNKLTTPAVSGDTVYVLSQDGTVSALSTSKGKLLWSYKTKTLYNPGDVTVANGIVYATVRTGLFAINATSGKLVWSQQTDPTQILVSPDAVGNSVYLASYSVPPHQTGIAHSGLVYSYDAKSGTLNWQHPIDDWVGTPTIVNGIVYAGSYDTNLYALKASDGSELWHYTTGGQIFASPLVSNNVVYVEASGNATIDQPSTVNPALFAIDATKGTKLWSQQLDMTPETIQDGVIYGSVFPRAVYALKASDGSTIWHQQYGPDLIDKLGNHSGAPPEITVIP